MCGCCQEDAGRLSANAPNALAVQLYIALLIACDDVMVCTIRHTTCDICMYVYSSDSPNEQKHRVAYYNGTQGRNYVVIAHNYA